MNSKSSLDDHHSRGRPSSLRDGQQNRQSPADRAAAGANPPDGGSHRASALRSCRDRPRVVCTCHVDVTPAVCFAMFCEYKHMT